MAKKTKKYAFGGQLNTPQAMTPRKPIGAPSGPPKSVPVKTGSANTAMGVPSVLPPKSAPVRPTRTANTAIPANVSSFLAANKDGALTKGPSWASSMQTALKNPPRVTPEIQGMADMASAIARGPRPNPLNPTGSLNGPRFAGMGMKKGGSVSSASKRADGIATKGKTKGKIC